MKNFVEKLQIVFIALISLLVLVSVQGIENSTDEDYEYSVSDVEEYNFEDLLMEPTPEDVALTIQMEKELQNDKFLECTTKEDVDLKEAPAISRIKIRRMKWKNFSVYIDPAYNYRDRTLINNAMARLYEILKPCGVRFGIFRPGARPVGDFVHIFDGNGCYSMIGKTGRRQPMSLDSPGCMRMDTILHELIHSLGLHHEQNRLDRDDYVKILWQNIQGHARVQFEKTSFREETTFGVEYDQNSIMHYGPTAFSKNGHPTIIAKNGKSVGSEGGLTTKDIEKLKRLYC